MTNAAKSGVDVNWESVYEKTMKVIQERLTAWLEGLDDSKLDEIWAQARPGERVPENHVEKGYSLVEYFTGC